MERTLKRILITGGTLVAALIISIYLVLTLAPAHAATANTISCGNLECYVSSSAQASNSYQPTVEEEAEATQHLNNSGQNRSPYSYVKQNCLYWLPVGGGTSSNSYPVQNSNTYQCAIEGSFGGGAGYTANCPPLHDRASNGAVYKYFSHPDGTSSLLSYHCAYPTDDYAPVERITGTGRFYISGDGKFRNVSSPEQAHTFNSNGKITDSLYRETGFDINNPAATPNLDLTFNARTGTNTDGTPLYGWYRLSWDLTFRACNNWAYPAVFGIPSRWECNPPGSEQRVTPYTYACNINPALQEGIIPGAIFRPSLCQPNWECQFNPTITINGAGDWVDVMRNGERLPTEHGAAPTLTGNGAVNPRAWIYTDTVVKGSTPYAGATDSNPKQLFKKFNRTGQQEDFGKQLPVGANSQNQFTAFNWASDVGSSWQFTRQYRFTADFIVPTQTGIGAGSITRPVTETVNCRQQATSPRVTVLRSVNA